jgi:hypothetical protein
MTTQVMSAVKTWIKGDFVYAAVRCNFPPKNTAHILVNGREYPVAQVSPLDCNEYSLIRFMQKDETYL